MTLTYAHVYCNVRAMKALTLQFMNPARMDIYLRRVSQVTIMLSQRIQMTCPRTSGTVLQLQRHSSSVLCVCRADM